MLRWDHGLPPSGVLSGGANKQGRSGLGLEAQRASVAAHAVASGCAIIASYTEIETGKRDTLENRPELRKAIAHSKRSKAVLVVAKLDRLSRSVAVTSLLHQSGVEFIACDNPNANRLTIQILAAVAEDEAQRISDRTKPALLAYKARGGLLGASHARSRNLTPESRRKGALRCAMGARRSASEAYEDITETMQHLRAKGLSLRQIAATLTDAGQTTRRGKAWNPMQVGRVLKAAFLEGPHGHGRGD
jgi:DNA invertase Pin-like site-specific DNA recombinase